MALASLKPIEREREEEARRAGQSWEVAARGCQRARPEADPVASGSRTSVRATRQGRSLERSP